MIVWGVVSDRYYLKAVPNCIHLQVYVLQENGISLDVFIASQIRKRVNIFFLIRVTQLLFLSNDLL